MTKSTTPMNFAILAAGEGSRLASEGVVAPKPLVELNGQVLIDRLIQLFVSAGAEQIHIIVNEQQRETINYLAHYPSKASIKTLIQSTPSSMHSFFEIAKMTGDAACCLTTVDTIFDPQLFQAYIHQFQTQSQLDALMGVTTYIEDESPLYIQCGSDMHIHGFLDEVADCTYISGGIYCFRPSVFPILRQLIANGGSRMRNFQRQLIADGLQVDAYDLGKIIDIDHASDIKRAEELLRSFEFKITK